MTAIAWANRTAFGSPLVPEVKIIIIGSAPLTSMGHQWFRGRDRIAVRGAVDVKHGHTTQVQTVEQRQVLGVDEQQLAVGPADVGCQPLAAARGVDPAQHVPAERGRRHRSQHRRGIPQQRTDMQRTVGRHQADQGRSLRRCLGEVLAPGPLPVAVQHRDGVVFHARAQQLLNGFETLRTGLFGERNNVTGWSGTSQNTGATRMPIRMSFGFDVDQFGAEPRPDVPFDHREQLRHRSAHGGPVGRRATV